MNFQQSVETCLRKYINFEGRASRSEFWWFTLFSWVVQILLSIISAQLATVALVALLLPSLAVLVRRLHDTETSGWWALLLLIPVIGFLIILYFMLMPSNTGPNKYGEQPV